MVNRGFYALPIENRFSGASVYYIEETDSTMADAETLISSGKGHGNVVVAGYQRAGRGRFPTRRWINSPGSGLLMSIIISAEKNMSSLGLMPCLAALAVTRAVKSTGGVDCKIKWPNDILIRGKKVAGILCKNKGGFVIVGIGINVHESPTLDHDRYLATSITHESATEIAPRDFVAPVIDELYCATTEKMEPSVISKYLFLRNSRATISLGLPEDGNKVTGIIQGIAADGQLIVLDEKSHRPVLVASGEIELPSRSPSRE